MNNHNILSRRSFLKLSGAGLLGMVFGMPSPDQTLALSGPMQGRVIYGSLIVRDAPRFNGVRVNSFPRDSVLEITEQVFGGTEGDYNRTWYRIGEKAYVYSGGVQPVDTIINKVEPNIPESGILGEITIPRADSLWAVNRNPYPGPHLYFGSTHWIEALVVDHRDGSLWYKAYDNLFDSYYYTRPEWVRILPAGETSPLSPLVPEEKKYLHIFLDRQILIAYEWDVPVYAARVATGQKNFESPTGTFRTFHKRPTYHMTGGYDDATVFDLPGVPWDTYITDTGVAIHGTYWHNDFGTPHSHGCINMTPQDAKWIFRWTLPKIPEGERVVLTPGTGTLVRITA
jgi:hypothetical protein